MDLHAFADDLADRLPGAWTVEHHPHLTPEQATDLADRLCGPSVPDRDLDHAAILSEPGRPLGLLATAYTTRGGQFAKIDTLAVDLGNLELIFYQDTPRLGTTAPLATGTGATFERSMAARTIAGYLLPVHERLLDVARTDLLERSLHEAQLAVDQWDAISDGLCDAQGFPLDDHAYSAGLVRRDAAVVAHLEEVLPHSLALAQTARTRLNTLDDHTRRTVRTFFRSLADTARILDDWRAALPGRVDADGAPLEPAYTDALHERNETAWHPAHQWLSHGPAMVALLRALAHGPGGTRATSATTRSPALDSAAKPTDSPPQPDPGPGRVVRSRPR